MKTYYEVKQIRLDENGNASSTKSTWFNMAKFARAYAKNEYNGTFITDRKRLYVTVNEWEFSETVKANEINDIENLSEIAKCKETIYCL